MGSKIEVIPITSRSQWLSERRRDVTASDIGALFGCHPYRTLAQVWGEKHRAAESRGDLPAMRRGRVMEPAVAEAVREAHPDWHINKAHSYLRRSEWRLGCTPDYYLEPEGADLDLPMILQCKTVSPEKWQDWNEQPPLAYTLQTLTEALVCDAPSAKLAILVMNRALDLHIFDVPRHEAAEARIITATADFWALTEPPTGWQHDADAVAALFPKDNGKEIDLSADNALPELLQERAVLKAQMSEAEKRCEVIETEVKAKIGDAAKAMLRDWRITYKSQHRAEKLMPAADFRVLRIVRNKDE